MLLSGKPVLIGRTPLVSQLWSSPR